MARPYTCRGARWTLLHWAQSVLEDFLVEAMLVEGVLDGMLGHWDPSRTLIDLHLLQASALCLRAWTLLHWAQDILDFLVSATPVE